MTGANHIDVEMLADYWLAALTEADEARIEEHLLACDQCGARLRDVIALGSEIRQLAREGNLRLVMNDAFLERVRKDRHVREYTVPSGGAVFCTVTEDDDLLVARLAADLGDASRVDLRFYDDRGTELFRLPDIPSHPDTRSVLYQESMAFAKSAPTMTLVGRLIKVDDAGREQVIGEYTFNHSRSLPGSGV